MATFISHSPAETESLGEKFGRAAERGLVIALSGELGAGKTQLVKGADLASQSACIRRRSRW
jgi:tRNA threonylcarbamoyladenosine biosynthesis protein TsaE